MIPKKKGVAFFDFDGTISFKDSFIEFIRFTHGSLRLYLCVLSNAPFIFLFYLNLYPNQKLKERFFSFFYKGVSEDKLIQEGKQFTNEILKHICYDYALKRIEWHKTQDHDIYLLTASSSIWLGHWCKHNDLKIIGTNFETLNGKYTGKIDGKNCYGIEKIIRIKPILNNYKVSYGYGDSQSDKHYLKQMTYSYLQALKNEIPASKLKASHRTSAG